jgi:toxin CptA
MHRPPAASHSVQRSRWHLTCIVSIILIAMAACTGFWQSTVDFSFKCTVFAFLVLSGAWAAKDWFYAERGLLRWDGQQWLWSGFGDVPVQRLFVVLDFQRLILVKVEADHAGSSWMWLETPHRNRQWLALRRAIVGTVAHP